MIELKVERELYPRIKPTIVKVVSDDKITPEEANKFCYALTGDIKMVRDIHDNKMIPPFSIKNLKDHSFDICLWLPISEYAAKKRAKQFNKKIVSIYYPEYDLPNVAQVKNITLEFTSPTAFRVSRSFIPYFEPMIFWGSCINLWRNATNTDKYDKEFKEYISTMVYPLKTDTETVKAFLNKELSFTGFVGTVILTFAKWTPPEYKILILTLLETVYYTGVGSKRAWGMGNVNCDIFNQFFSELEKT